MSATFAAGMKVIAVKGIRFTQQSASWAKGWVAAGSQGQVAHVYEDGELVVDFGRQTVVLHPDTDEIILTCSE